LQLDLVVEGDRVRFFFGTAPLPEADELVARLEQVVSEVTERAQQEAERAADLEKRLAEALAEIERLRGR
jgi:hypothetical protein